MLKKRKRKIKKLKIIFNFFITRTDVIEYNIQSICKMIIMQILNKKLKKMILSSEKDK